MSCNSGIPGEHMPPSARQSFPIGEKCRTSFEGVATAVSRHLVRLSSSSVIVSNPGYCPSSPFITLDENSLLLLWVYVQIFPLPSPGARKRKREEGGLRLAKLTLCGGEGGEEDRDTQRVKREQILTSSLFLGKIHNIVCTLNEAV